MWLEQAAVDWLQEQRRWDENFSFYFEHLYKHEGGEENRVMNNSTYLERLIHPLLIRKIARWKWISSMWEPGCGGMRLLVAICTNELCACWLLAGITDIMNVSGRCVSHSFPSSQLSHFSNPPNILLLIHWQLTTVELPLTLLASS